MVLASGNLTINSSIDKFKETLVKMNDKAVQDIQSGNCDSGLQMLERLKKVLEVEYPLYNMS